RAGCRVRAKFPCRDDTHDAPVGVEDGHGGDEVFLLGEFDVGTYGTSTHLWASIQSTFAVGLGTLDGVLWMRLADVEFRSLVSASTRRPRNWLLGVAVSVALLG